MVTLTLLVSSAVNVRFSAAEQAGDGGLGARAAGELMVGVVPVQSSGVAP
jgi:hypothetical protein